MKFEVNTLSKLLGFNSLSKHLPAASIAALLTLPALVQQVQAADNIYQLNIPAGSLSQSLITLTDNTNSRLLVSSK